jgi:hypothetical protein
MVADDLFGPDTLVNHNEKARRVDRSQLLAAELPRRVNVSASCVAFVAHTKLHLREARRLP